MKKPGIPPAPKAGDERIRFDQSVKETLEIFKGDRGSRITALDESTATAADCAAKINEILSLLQ